MDSLLFPALVIGASAFPVCILIPAQIYLSLQAEKKFLKALPLVFCAAALLAVCFLFPSGSILKLLGIAYCVLLMILCGAGWVIAYSIRKSRRN